MNVDFDFSHMYTFVQSLDDAIELNPEVKPLVEATRNELKGTLERIQNWRREHFKRSENSWDASPWIERTWARDGGSRLPPQPCKSDKEAPDARMALEKYFDVGAHLYEGEPSSFELFETSKALNDAIAEKLIEFRMARCQALHKRLIEEDKLSAPPRRELTEDEKLSATQYWTKLSRDPKGALRQKLEEQYGPDWERIAFGHEYEYAGNKYCYEGLGYKHEDLF